MFRTASVLCLAVTFFFGGLASLFGQNTSVSAPTRPATPAVPPPPPLRIAVYAHAPPMVFMSGEKFSGIEADFARGFAAALGRPVQFIDLDWNDLIPAVLDDRADIIMSGLSITQLRQVRVAFCQPYLRIGQVPLCRRGELALYGNNASLYNIRGVVGVVADTTADVLAREQFTYAQRIAFPTLKDAVQGLLDKKADLIITDFPLALWQSAENEAAIAVVPIFLTQEDLAWAVRKDDDSLGAAANAYLAQIKQNGQLTQIIRKWLPMAADSAIAPTLVPDNTAPGLIPSALPIQTPGNGY
jgi:polar amino acid transport system substrate-binding protein